MILKKKNMIKQLLKQLMGYPLKHKERGYGFGQTKPSYERVRGVLIISGNGGFWLIKKDTNYLNFKSPIIIVAH